MYNKRILNFPYAVKNVGNTTIYTNHKKYGLFTNNILNYLFTQLHKIRGHVYFSCTPVNKVRKIIPISKHREFALHRLASATHKEIVGDSK